MLGNTISQYRKKCGLTQAQLAEKLGVSAPAVNKWEKDLCYPDTDLIVPLALSLGIDVNTLFSFDAVKADGVSHDDQIDSIQRRIDEWTQVEIILTSERLQLIIDELCDGSKDVFVMKTGVDPEKLDSYINRENKIGYMDSFLISRAFNINSSWIAGMYSSRNTIMYN